LGIPGIGRLFKDAALPRYVPLGPLSFWLFRVK